MIKSCIDSVSAEVAKQQPKPEFITSNADYRLQKKAELLTQYIDGTFYDNKVYTDISPDVFKDACLFGTGAISVFNDGERIKYERVLIDELYIDEFDGLYRKPKEMMHVRRVFRDKLRERFQDDTTALQAISDAPTAPSLDPLMPQDMILVAEAWRLPYKTKSPKDSKDKKKSKTINYEGGTYALCLENYDLYQEDYKKDYFPFVFFRWNNKTTGFLGQGLAEELVPLQLEAARTLQAISRGLRFSGLRVFLEAGSQINPNHLNDDGSKGIPVTHYNGTPPITANWQSASQETYSHLENIYRKGYEISGISQMMAFANKPSGITAAKALETIQDQQSKRFMLVSDRYEQMHLDLALLTIDQSKDLFAQNPDLSIQTIVNNNLKEIRWKDVDMDSDRFQMKAFPINAFSDSPAARLQQITAALQAGWLSQQRAEQLLEVMPDFKSEVSLSTSSLSRVRKALDDIIHDNTYNQPDIYLNLEEAETTAQAVLNLSFTNGVEEDKLQMIRNYIDDIHTLKGLSNPPQASQTPLATPAPLPQSDLMPMGPAPNTPQPPN